MRRAIGVASIRPIAGSLEIGGGSWNCSGSRLSSGSSILGSIVAVVCSERISETVATSSPALPTTAMVCPTGTMVPSGATILRRTPSESDSNSTTALSVSISATGSFLLTAAPSSFSQRTTVPSSMSYPIWGIFNSVAISDSSPLKTEVVFN